MEKDQRLEEGRVGAEDGKLNHEDSSDDEEVKLLPHRKGVDEPDLPGADIRDVPEASGTQREEWLLTTEPLLGARPKWNTAGQPPVVPEQIGALNAEATGGIAGRNIEHRGAPTPLLLLDRQNMQEGEVVTPRRTVANGHTGASGLSLPNGWNDATAALQLLSHLEGDALNVALLVPISRRTSRKGLVDALSAHYGSPGRLADYRRQFEKTTRSAGEDPSIFATALETLAVKAFGDMGQMA